MQSQLTNPSIIIEEGKNWFLYFLLQVKIYFSIISDGHEINYHHLMCVQLWKVPNEIIQLNCHNIVLSRWRPPLIQMAIQSQIPLFFVENIFSISRVHVREIQLREFSINYIIIIFLQLHPLCFSKRKFHGICTTFTRLKIQFHNVIRSNLKKEGGHETSTCLVCILNCPLCLVSDWLYHIYMF